MSSISSYDSYHISVDDEFSKRLDELESGSGSGSGSDTMPSFSWKENELDLVCMYLKCKRNVFFWLSESTRSKALYISVPTMLLSSCLIILPMFTLNVYILSSFAGALTACLCAYRYFDYDVRQHVYMSYSNKYGKLHSNVDNFLAKLVYVVDKRPAFYEKTIEIEKRLSWECDGISIPLEIRTAIPVVGSIDIFKAIHAVEMDNAALTSQYKRLKRQIGQLNMENDESKSRRENMMVRKKSVKAQLQKTTYANIKEALQQEYNDYLARYDPPPAL
jgi:hypothetical protein